MAEFVKSGAINIDDGAFMRLFQTALFVVSLVPISGRELHQVKGEVGGVQLDARAQSGKEDFCSPGQAKKEGC